MESVRRGSILRDPNLKSVFLLFFICGFSSPFFDRDDGRNATREVCFKTRFTEHTAVSWLDYLQLTLQSRLMNAEQISS